jgi:hypothetical protein
MKIVFVLSILMFYMNGFAQVDEIKMKKSYGEMDFAPQIAGYFDGEIPVDKICDTRGIYTRRGLKVIVFDIDYHDGEENKKVHVVGNQIPDSVCVYIRKYKVGNEIFFTNIKAVDLDGSIKNLSPLRLVAIKQEDNE